MYMYLHSIENNYTYSNTSYNYWPTSKMRPSDIVVINIIISTKYTISNMYIYYVLSIHLCMYMYIDVYIRTYM